MEKHGYTAALVKYLDNPPDKKELKDILRKLGMQPQQLLRTGESVYKQHYATLALSDDAWLDAMVTHPVLIERPIVVRGNRAVIARPPEKVLTLL